MRRTYTTYAPSERRRFGCADLLFFVLVGGLITLGAVIKGPELLVNYGVVPVDTMCATFPAMCKNAPASVPPTTAPAVDRPIAPASVPRSYTTTTGSTLPKCSTVSDTTTACEQDAAPAAVEQLPTEAPAPTATPPYLSDCQTAPGERPCWLPAEAVWTELDQVPATPIVVLPDPPSVDVCAMWHPPLPYPEACDE